MSEMSRGAPWNADHQVHALQFSGGDVHVGKSSAPHGYSTHSDTGYGFASGRCWKAAVVEGGFARTYGGERVCSFALEVRRV